MTSQRAISIAFQTDKPLSAYGPLAAQGEAYGFDGVSVYNDMLYQPVWLPLLEIARHTERVRIGPAAVNPFTSHPINIAGHVALIDEAAQGRAYLGLARGSWLDFVGIEPTRPITAVREALECIQHLLQQSTEPYRGEIFQLAGGDSLRWEIFRADVPFLLGTWGPKTMRACVPYVNEVKVGGTANPDVIPHIRAYLDEAASETGQTSGKIGIVAGAVTVVDEDGEAARERARREVSLYLPIVARLDPSLDLDEELLSHITDAANRYDFERAATYISDDLLRRFAFAGTPNEVAEHALELFEAGATRVEFGTPHGLTTREGLRLLGEEVLPAVRNT